MTSAFYESWGVMWYDPGRLGTYEGREGERKKSNLKDTWGDQGRRHAEVWLLSG